MSNLTSTLTFVNSSVLNATITYPATADSWSTFFVLGYCIHVVYVLITFYKYLLEIKSESQFNSQTGDIIVWTCPSAHTHRHTLFLCPFTYLLLWKRCRGSVLWQDESWQPKSLTSRVPTSLRLALWERRGKGSSGAKNFSYRDSDMARCTWHRNRGKDMTTTTGHLSKQLESC